MASGWHKESIRNVIEKIQRNEMLLPAIQRKFVWDEEQIIALMDSLMKCYPIGTFLFWKVTVRAARTNEYTFYKFIEHYHEKESAFNERISLSAWDSDKVIWGVLDGQQRLNSLLIAIAGSYAAKVPRKHWDNPAAFPRKELYLDLLSAAEDDSDEERTTAYGFRFFETLPEGDSDHVWFKISDIFDVSDDAVFQYGYSRFKDDYSVELIGNVIVPNLERLRGALVKSEQINFFQVESDDMDKVLDIFVRTNSGGTVLSRSDLIFSTIVSVWQDGREEVDDLIKKVADRGFRVNGDFVVKACLASLDLPIRLKVSNLTRSRVAKIEDNWSKIRNAVIRTFDLLRRFGFNHDRIMSYNAVIPIVYLVYKGLSIDGGSGSLDGITRRELNKYIVISQVKRLFSTSSNTAIARVIEALRVPSGDGYELRAPRFAMELLEDVEMPNGGSFVMTEHDIDELFDIEKGPHALMVLYLLYPNISTSSMVFHIDHMHPYAAFEDANFDCPGISEEKHEEWKRERNTLANLQLLEGPENESKSAMSLVEWLEGKEKAYIGYLPEGISYELANFDEFLDKRRELMAEKLKEKLAVGGLDGRLDIHAAQD